MPGAQQSLAYRKNSPILSVFTNFSSVVTFIALVWKAREFVPFAQHQNFAVNNGMRDLNGFALWRFFSREILMKI